MAHSLKLLYRNSNILLNITKPVICSTSMQYPMRVLASGFSYQNNSIWKPLSEPKQISVLPVQIRNCCKQQGKNAVAGGTPSPDPPEKVGLFQKFKQMYRDYWYVLGPVHIATSAVWLGSFYYVVRSGVDILGMVESLGVSDELIAPLRDSSAGYFALTFALYKIATPLRYAVTVGGTTYAIRKLTAMGWIKPVPSRERLKEMLQEKKDNLQDRFNESKQHYQTNMKQRGIKVMDEMRRYKTEMRNIKNKEKKT